MKGFAQFLFFGNYFYGFCAIALSVEASLQQHISLNSFSYYVMVFAVTVGYYTHAYISEPISQASNKRAVWYRLHKKKILLSQYILSLVFLGSFFYWIIRFGSSMADISTVPLLLSMIFPLLAVLYYGIVQTANATHSLRNNGWLKPFVIGFVWAGAVTVFPKLFYTIENRLLSTPDYVNSLLFIKNFLFISILCILFDIKDYATDYNQQIKTFVVRIGLRKTLFFVLIPLSFIGLGAFILYAILHNFSIFRILINTIPFILLIIVSYSMHRRKSILYYLAIIDGLMLVKAVCGIIGILLIK